MRITTYLPKYLSNHSSIYPPSFRPSIHPYIRLNQLTRPFTFPSIHPSMNSSIYPLIIPPYTHDINSSFQPTCIHLSNHSSLLQISGMNQMHLLRWIDRLTTGNHIEGEMSSWMSGRKDWWTDRWRDGWKLTKDRWWMDESMDGWMTAWVMLMDGTKDLMVGCLESNLQMFARSWLMGTTGRHG